MAEAELAGLDTVLYDVILEKGEINVGAVNRVNNGVLRTSEGALRALATINSLLTEEPSLGLRNYHVLKNSFATKIAPEVAEENHRYALIRKLILDLSSRLEKEGFGDASMLFMESIAAAMESKSSAFKGSPKNSPKQKKHSTLKRMFSSDKGTTRRDLDYNLKHGRGLQLDCSTYAVSILAEEILRLLEESSPLLCEDDKAVFNKYVFVQAKNEGWTKIQGFITLISALPERNQVILKDLFKLLNEVWDHADVTGMDDEMLAFAVAPRLLRPDKNTKVESVMNSRAFVQGAVLVILRNSEIICRTPAIVLSQGAFDCMQKIVDTILETLCPLVASGSRQIVLAMESLLRVTECIRVVRVGKADKKYPFLRCSFSGLPHSFWTALATIRREYQEPVDIAKSLLTNAYLANLDETYTKELMRSLLALLEVSETEISDIIAVQKEQKDDKNALRLPQSDLKEDSPRRSTVNVTTTTMCAAPGCEKYPLVCVSTKFCRFHFEEYRMKEDPKGERRVRGKKPGRNCDILTTLPAVIFDCDLGMKLSSSAASVIHSNSNYSDNLAYDIVCPQATAEVVVVPPEDEVPPPPPSGPPPMADWSLVRRRRAPPPLSGFASNSNGLNMSEEEATQFVLKTVRATLEGEYLQSGSTVEAQEALQPPAHLNMAQPHLKIVWEIITTEETYVKILKYVADCYVAKLRAGGSNGLTLDEVDLLFRNIARMSLFHTNLLSHLYRRFCTWTDELDTQRIGEIFVNFDDFFRIYPTYVNKHDEALELLRRVNANSGRYARFIQMQKDARESPLSPGLDLASCLIAPIQRIPRYRLLIQEVLKQYAKSFPEHPDIAMLEKALQVVLVYANQVNEQLRRSEQERDMLALKEELTGAEKHGQLVTGARFLLHRGNLMRVCRKSVRVYHFFLFNDLLLYTTKSPSQPGRGATYAIQKWIPVDETFSVTPFSLTPAGENQDRWQVRSKVKSFEIYPEDPAKYTLWNEKFQSLTRIGENTEEAAPVWEPDAKTVDCPWCQRKFTVVRRRHHCRDCGDVVCGQCSSQKLVLPTSNGKTVRVCDRCFEQRNLKQQSSVSEEHSGEGSMMVPSGPEPRGSYSTRLSVTARSPNSRRSSIRNLLTVLKPAGERPSVSS